MESERLFELARRTFDTHGFQGLEFIEVEAKTVINRVAGNAMPFNWTINPYRGCSHACSYCEAGDTPILMADGRLTPLADVRPGDRVYGTAFDGKYHRYVVTDVLDHWSTIKPAYRVTLSDGTTLVASGDHRFLSDRGWKHVTGREQGPDQRPHLTTRNRLIGTGHFASPPSESDDYCVGYLTGMIRGDGQLGTYSYTREGRSQSTVHRFRLALADLEGLHRARRYLSERQVETQEFLFHTGTETTRPMMAIRTQAGRTVAAITELISWPDNRSQDWHKGFLAGIFDAEGSCSRGVLRISNTDPIILRAITQSFDALRFNSVLEDAGGRASAVRLRGGLKERLRFFHTVDPAITRKRSIAGMAMNSPTGTSPLRVVSIESLGVEIPMYDITTGTGDFIANGVVSHNCFARPTHTYMDMNAGRDFETKIVVKVNAVEALRAELRRSRHRGEHIAMGTATDPYQRAEGKYRLMPGIISALTEFRNPFSILTKGTLILRDLPMLINAVGVAPVSTAFSIGTVDSAVWKATEPGAPHPRKRIEAVARLNQSGVPCSVLMAPILPGISDSPDQLRATALAAIEAGATSITPILLHLRPVVREEFIGWLTREHPDLVSSYESLYPGSYASSGAKQALARAVDSIKIEAGYRPVPGVTWRVRDRRPVPQPVAPCEQLSLI